jgi:hypothetical protein
MQPDRDRFAADPTRARVSHMAEQLSMLAAAGTLPFEAHLARELLVRAECIVACLQAYICRMPPADGGVCKRESTPAPSEP